MGWKDNWFISDSTKESSAVEDSLDRLEEPDISGAYTRSFGLGGFGQTKDLGGGDLGGEEEPIEPEEGTVDYLVPAIAIGAGELLRLREKIPALPESFRAFGHKAPRFVGSKGIAFTMATHAADAGSFLGRKFLESLPGGEGRAGLEQKYIDIGAGVSGGAAAWGTYKGLPALANLIKTNVKIGMAHHVIPRLIEEASVSAYKTVVNAAVPGAYKGKTVIKKVMEKTPGFKKGTVKGILRKHPQLKDVKKIVPSAVERKATTAAAKASIKIEKELIEAMAKTMGTKDAKTWGDITKRLMNPNVAQKVGKFIAKRMPSVALKLGVSSAGFVFPEVWSTAAGAVGIAATAYDLYNATQYIPGLLDIIFEDAPVETQEDQIINDFTSPDSVVSAIRSGRMVP